MTSIAKTTYQDGIEGKLLSAVTTTTTTGITFKIKQINGATPTAPTAAFRVHVTQKTATTSKHEIWDVAAGTSQSGQTVTLGTVTRKLSLSDPTDFTGTGTAQSFSAGADVYFPADARDLAYSAKIDLNNTFSNANTFSGLITSTAGISMSGTSSYLKVPSLTTAQRTALSASNGMIVYDSDIGVHYQYIGGAWSTFASGTTSNAADHTAGKVDIASATEIGAGTATDGTSGAINVIPVSQTAKTSSGASDENKLPVLNSSGQLAIGFINPSTSDFFGTGADGAATISSNTSLSGNKQYTNLTIDGGFALNPAGYIIKVNGTLTLNGNIASNGGAGGNAVVDAAGSAGTAAHTAGTLPAAKAGKAGAAGVTGSNQNGVAGTAGNAETGFIGNGAAGGIGGTGGSTAGAAGAGGTLTAGTVIQLFSDLSANAGGSVTTSRVMAGSAGAGSGGSGATGGLGGTTGGGGGSGGNGGHVVIYAKKITGAGNITATGGAGGSGGVGTGAGTADGGGGGGGSGGYVFVYYSDKTGWSGSATAAGGAAGTKGGSVGSPADGAAGTAGIACVIPV